MVDQDSGEGTEVSDSASTCDGWVLRVGLEVVETAEGPGRSPDLVTTPLTLLADGVVVVTRLASRQGFEEFVDVDGLEWVGHGIALFRCSAISCRPCHGIRDNDMGSPAVRPG